MLYYIHNAGVKCRQDVSGTLTQLLKQWLMLQYCIFVQCRSRHEWWKRRALLETLFLKALPLAIEGANASYCCLKQQHLQAMYTCGAQG